MGPPTLAAGGAEARPFPKDEPDSMRVAVLGGGSWGTTVASLLAPKHDTVLWARNPDVAKSIATDHVNPVYLPGFELASELAATSDLEEAVSRGRSSRRRRADLRLPDRAREDGRICP